MERDIRDLSTLKRGDIVRNKHMGDSYVVDHAFGKRVTAVRTMEISNPREWVLWIDKFTPLADDGPLEPDTETYGRRIERATGTLIERYFATPGADQWTHSELEAVAKEIAEEQDVHAKWIVAKFGRMLIGRPIHRDIGQRGGSQRPLVKDDALDVQMTREQSALIAKFIRQALKTSGPWTAEEVAEGMMLAGCAEDTATSENNGAVNGWCL